METKIKKLKEEIELFKVEVVKKDKIIFGQKNKNADLTTKMAKLKGEYAKLFNKFN